MSRHFSVLVIVSLACVLLISSAAAATARNGRIVFEADVHGLPQLFTISPDGTGLKKVTHNPLGAEHAVWSRDGSSLLFVLHTRGSDLIYSAKADGSNLTRVSAACSRQCLGDGFPVYSPDGARIAFERTFAPRGNNSAFEVAIFSMKPDGRDLVQLTQRNISSEDHEAQWLPNGKIAFTRLNTTAAPVGAGAIFLMNVDGKNTRELTPFSTNYPNDAKWSPDGSTLLFDATTGLNPSAPANVFTMRPDGTKRVQLTHFKDATVKAFVGAWSPDGKWIVWHRGGSGPVNKLFVMDASGRQLRQLTHMPHRMRPRVPAWGTAR